MPLIHRCRQRYFTARLTNSPLTSAENRRSRPMRLPSRSGYPVNIFQVPGLSAREAIVSLCHCRPRRAHNTRVRRAVVFRLDGNNTLIVFRPDFQFFLVAVVRSVAIVAGDVGVFIVVVKIHAEAAGAIYNFAVLAHFFAVERDHFVARRILVALVFEEQ